MNDSEHESGHKRPRSSDKGRQPPKGLLQYGFTGATNNSTPELSPCPHCSGLYTVTSIVEHTENCKCNPNNVVQGDVCATDIDGEHEGLKRKATQKNAFDIMRSSAALKPKATASATNVYFSLILKDQKVYPEFSTQPFQPDHTNPQEFPVWTCESNVRKLRWQFRTNGEDSTRDVKLHLTTNIPSNTRIISSTTSMAATAVAQPISTALLKSMFQKAVRRRQALKAIKLCAALCPRDQDVVSSPPLSVTAAEAQFGTGRSPVSSPQKGTAATQQSPARVSYAKAASPVPNKRGTPAAGSTSTAGAGASASNGNSPLSELLRRLPIVCLEDTALHPALPIVTWLMVAVSKGYEPTEWLINVVLLMVADIGTCAYRDCIPSFDTSVYTPLQQQQSSTSAVMQVHRAADIDVVNLTDDSHPVPCTWESITNDSVRTILASVAIRASFGGMGGDMKMLDKYTELWYERLVGDANQRDTKMPRALQHSSTVSALLPSVDSCMYKYLHPEYTNTFFAGGKTPTLDGWAVQLFDNFPPIFESTTTNASINSTVSPSRLRTDVVYVVQTHLRDVVIHLSTTGTGSAIDSNNATIAPPRHGSLSNILKVSAKDTVSEGIDQHVDWGLVPHLLNVCSDKLTQYVQQQQGAGSSQDNPTGSKKSTYTPLEEDIKSAIWMFRSSNNSRKLYPYLHTLTQDIVSTRVVSFNKQLVDRELSEKRRLAKLWSIICPELVAYCDRKIAAIGRRL